MLLDTLRSFYQKHRKNIFFVWFFVVLFFVLWEGVFANEDLLKKEDAEKITKFLNFFLAAAAIILWMITSLISMFLYPGWVNGSLFDMQLYFRDIWILISNVVYFLFAGILIIIAFMNIIWKWEWTWELKQAMPKFIVWVLIVPFSWFFVQFILSISSIFTVWVLTLPYDVFQDRPQLDQVVEGKIWQQTICTDIIIDLKWKKWTWDSLQSVVWWDSDLQIPEILKCWEWRTTIAELLRPWSNSWEWMKNSIYWVINIYTYWILRVQNLDTIKEDEIPEWIQDLAKLIFKIVFDLLFVVVYLLLMVALFLALFVRVVRLWIYMMMSPAFGLLYFFGKWSEWVGEWNNKFSIKEFISLAMVPVYVSAALAFGLVFIMVAGTWVNNTSWDTDKIEAWGFSLTLIWVLWDKWEWSTIWQLIVQIFWIVILWIAVMAALKTSSTTWAIIEPIESFWKSVWQLAAKAPTYAPIIPTGAWKERMSAAGLWRFGTTFKGAIEWKAIERGGTFANELAWLGDNSKLTKSINTLNNTLWAVNNEGEAKTRAVAEEFKAMIHSTNWDADKLLRDPDFKATVWSLWGKLGIKDLDTTTQKWLAISIDKVMEKLHWTWIDFDLGKGQNAVGDIQTWQQFEQRLKDSKTWQNSWNWNNDASWLDKKFEDYKDGYKKVRKSDNTEIKVKKEASWVIQVIARELDGGSEVNNYTMNTTLPDANSFNWDDIVEAKKLYENLRNDKDFKEVLKAAWFENLDKLLDDIKPDTTT